jgi:hypothetical protein
VAFFFVSWTLSAFSRFSFTLSSRLPMTRLVCCWAHLVSIVVWELELARRLKGKTDSELSGFLDTHLEECLA